MHNDFDSDPSAELSDEQLRDWLLDGEQASTVVAWAGDDADRRAWLAEFRAAYEATQRPMVSGDVMTALHRLHVRIGQSDLDSSTDAVTVRDPLRQDVSRDVSRDRSSAWAVLRAQRGTWSLLAGFAAGVAVLATGWTLLHPHAAATSRMTTYVTGNGQRATISLPDGSSVLLNVASRLDVPADYASGNHALRLSGEGLFIVTHRSSIPFSVTAGNSTTNVLGTSFVVRRYAADSVVTVAVKDGKVSVGSSVVTALRLAIIGANGQARLQAADSSQFSFATGVLTLNAQSLADAIPALNRWYDVDIRVADPAMRAQQIKGGFRAGSTADLADILELTLDARIVRDGRVLTLYPMTQ